MSTNIHIPAELPKFFKELTKAPAKKLAAPVSRRDFFKISGITGGGLALGVAAMGSSPEAKAQFGSGNLSTLSPYVQIQTNGRINIFSKNPECGQGIKTGLPLIIAEELDVRWEDVDVVQAPTDGMLYGGQFAGGSMSTPMNWMGMRMAGATARAMILAAAAARLDVPVTELSTSESKVIHSASGREFGYGEFAEIAATMPVPEAQSLKLKDQSEFTLLGKRYTGVDNIDLVQGKPLFGIDQIRPNMAYATYTKCPSIGGTVTSFNESHIKSLPGVLNAFVIEPQGDALAFSTEAAHIFGGVAIVATSTWAAIKAKRELEVEWDYSNAASASWSASVEKAHSLKGTDGETELKNIGDVAAATSDAKTVVEGFYEYAYISHTNLEPQNCTAVYENGHMEIWAPTQMPGGGETGVSKMLSMPVENVVLNTTRIGGGFGRRLANDYVAEVAIIAEKMEGTPIKLQWTREDDMAFDYYRPGAFHSYKASLDAEGRLTSLQDHFISFTGNGTTPTSSGEMNPTILPMDRLENVKVTQTLQQAAIPTGPMRAPSSNVFGFTFQSFLDECAAAAGRDYRDFLLEILAIAPPPPPPPAGMPPGMPAFAGMNDERAMNVIKAVTEKAGWGKEMPAGRGLGLAFYYSHSGYVAQVADVSVNDKKEVKIHKIYAVSDFGYIHNLSSAENQVQGSILDGVSQMMGSKISFENGAVEQLNFHQYPMLRLSKAPDVDVSFLEPAGTSPSGSGEPAMPPTPPAVANAIFAASGVRVRKMPLSESGYTLV